jgi:hypothetical protein
MDIMDSKLKCVFMMPNSETNNSGGRRTRIPTFTSVF